MGSSIEPAELRSFVALTESKISPKTSANLYGRAEMLAKMPMSLQRWIVAHASGEEYMGFVVDPYAAFLAYEIHDADAASALLPPGYRLVPTGMFADEAPRPTAILGAFNVRASFFWGTRVELYVIAENIATGMLTWVICDYESNTINYDPGEGFSAATTSRAILTTTHTGEVIVDVQSKERTHTLTVSAPVTAGSMCALDQRLWIDGNLSVDYGGRLMHEGSEPFGLIFDPAEMTQALRIPLDAVHVSANTFGTAFRDDTPFSIACFPYAQHFLTTSYPESRPINDLQSLEDAVRVQIAP
ncbi:hypothetical protein [Microbacterium sp. 2FI]|uniref:hypothetical protein n=1 Tax=Microbacterium sp. 2FI TaxID=2502193 RepID=UPI0010F737B5|nr:hypothetical protein [Microbacterium sp. 2FI]